MTTEHDDDRPIFQCVIYLKLGSTISTETSDPEAFITSLSGAMDRFYKRTWFRKAPTTVRLLGEPTVCIPIDHINFFSLVAKTKGKT